MNRSTTRTLLSLPLFCVPATLLAQPVLYDNTHRTLDADNADAIFPHRGDWFLAQPFNAGDSQSISSVEVNFGRFGNSEGTIDVSIWDDDGAGIPHQQIASVGGIDIGSLRDPGRPDSLDQISFEANVAGLTPNETYYLVADWRNVANGNAGRANSIWFGAIPDGDGSLGADHLIVTKPFVESDWKTSDWVSLANFGLGDRWLQMSIEGAPNARAILFDNMDLEPIENIPGAIGPRFTSSREDNAQQFLVGEYTNVSSVSLLVNKVGSPTGEVKVEIWEDREPGVPSSLVTEVGTIDLAELPNGRTEVTFDTLVTGLSPDSAYHLVMNNLNTNITSAQDSYRIGVLGNVNDPQKEGTNGAAFMLGSSPEEFNGAWTPVLDSLGCHPSGGCPNFQRMTVTAATLLGDFDEDGQLDPDDIDALSLEMRNGTNDRSFDLNNSATLTAADLEVWVEQLAGTHFGDANLDGTVDFQDFVSLSAGFGENGGWGQGDFDGNGKVEFEDFVALSGNFGQSATAVASAPEPSSLVLLVLGLATIKRRRSSDHRKNIIGN